jgi:hypothetical protein
LPARIELSGVRMNTKKTSKISAIVRVASGNFMEMFDFFLYGF